MNEKTLRSEYIFQGRAINLRIDTVEASDGRETTREIVEHADCIAVIPIDVNGDVLLVKQYRKAVDKELLEIPAGGIDPGETPEQAVCREMQEETGYFPGKIEKLGGFYSTPGYCTEYLYLYVVSELSPGKLFAEDTEAIRVIPTPVKKIVGLIDSGAICDSKSVAGLLLFLRRQGTK